MATNLPHLPDVERISDSPRIFRILGGNPSKFTLQGTNTYLLGSGPTRTLIDTAQGLPAWSSDLSELLAREKCAITTILLTHWHPDHIGGIPSLFSLPNATTPEIAVWKHDSTYLGGSRAAELSVSLENKEALRSDSWRGIDEGAEFALPGEEREGYKLRALHTPGHTTDHMSFLLLSNATNNSAHPKGHAMFTGDNILGHGTAVFEDLSAYMSSLHKMGDALPSGADSSQIKLYPGHGAVIDDGRAKVAEYVAHRAEREGQVLAVLERERERKALSSMDIVKVVYKDVDESLHGPAEGGVRQVLGKLEGEGRVVRDGEGWRVVGGGGNGGGGPGGGASL